MADGTAPRLAKTLVLVGMMGSGKTAVGGELSRRLDVPFIDSDHEIERAANAQIAEIFERDGEAFFREKESQVLARLLDGPPSVLSTGGGAFLSGTNRELIAERGVSVWLDADLELLWQRVRHKTTRPLLLTDDPKATLAAIYAARVPVYAKAQVRVKADPAYSIADMGTAVIRALQSTPGVFAAV